MVSIRDFSIQMPDGVNLSAREYLPDPGQKNKRKETVLIHQGLGSIFKPDPDRIYWKDTGDDWDTDDYIARWLAEHGFHSVLYNARSHGTSQGMFSVEKCLDDLDYISNETFKDRILFGLGHSLGGYLLLWNAANHPDRYQRIAVINPALSLQDKVPEYAKGFARFLESIDNPRIPYYFLLFSMNVFVLYKGRKKELVKEWLNNPKKFFRMFTHVHECRLKENPSALLRDWINSPDLHEMKIKPPCKVHGVIGQDDQLVKKPGRDASIEYARYLEKMVEDFSYKIYPDVNHALTLKNNEPLLLKDQTILEDILKFYTE